MKSIFKKFLLAGAIVAAPVAASALTVSTSGGVTGSSTCGAAFGVDAYQVDVLAGAHVNAKFVDGDAAGTQCFDLVNTSLSTAVVTVAVATVNQAGLSTAALSWGWLGGIRLDGGVATRIIAEGDAWLETFNFVIAAGSSLVFDWTYGEAYINGTSAEGNIPQFDFTVGATVVPVPAAGFLLMGALGGLGFAGRRRRKTA